MQRIVDDKHNIARLLAELKLETNKAEELYLTHRNNYWVTRNKFWLLCGVGVCFGLLCGCAVLLAIGYGKVRLSNTIPLLMLVLALIIFVLLFIAEQGERRVIRKFRRKYEAQYVLLQMVKKAP